MFDKRAVEKNQVVFHDVSYIEVKPHVKGNPVAVELTDFSVFYSQDSIANAEATLKNKANKIVVEKGQIVKVSKDKDGIVTARSAHQALDRLDRLLVGRFRFREQARDHPRAERANREGEAPAEPAGLGRSLDGRLRLRKRMAIIPHQKEPHPRTEKPAPRVRPGRRKIAVKVVDIFGNDTMTIVEITVGGKK